MPRPSRPFILALLLTALVVLPRSILIARAHSESWDDEYHLVRGLAAFSHTDLRAPYNDPPLGEAIESLPLFLIGIRPHPPSAFGHNHQAQLSNVLYGQITSWGADISPDTQLLIVAVWKSLLFLPFAAVVFAFAGDLYGPRAAWLALALILIEPTIAAHTPVAALDVLGMEFIVFAIFALYHYLKRPAPSRLVATAALTAAAMLIKHTGLITPLVAAVLLLLNPLHAPSLAPVPKRLRALAIAAALTLLFLWPLTFFDISPPSRYIRPPLGTAEPPPTFTETPTPSSSFILHPSSLSIPLPAGVYVGSLLEAAAHAETGHHAFLFGQTREQGFWYYYPVVAAYKIPISIALLIPLALFSLRTLRPKRPELLLLIPALAWTAFLMSSNINIGFRHFLPAYVFYLLLLARTAACGFALRTTVWTLALLSFLHTLTYHPDYLSYINFPRHKPYWDISDSNVDWGQSRKQIQSWLAAHPTNRPVNIRPFTDPQSIAWLLAFGPRPNIHVLTKYDPPPTTGLLILSMVREPDPYDPHSPYPQLRPYTPDATIGHSTVVYDLDRLGNGHPFHWSK